LTVASLRRTLAAAFLVACAAIAWSSTTASAVGSLNQQATVLEIKDRAFMIQQLATQIASQTGNSQVKALALGVAYDARKLHDGAEKVLRP
jgi:hypothetical protein